MVQKKTFVTRTNKAMAGPAGIKKVSPIVQKSLKVDDTIDYQIQREVRETDNFAIDRIESYSYSENILELIQQAL